MRSDWMRGLLDAEECVKQDGLELAYQKLERDSWDSIWSGYTPDNMLKVKVDNDYWRGFADYLHNYELRNKEGEV